MGIVINRVKLLLVLMLIVVWLLSCGLSYRYAKQQVELTALRDFQKEVAEASVKRRQMIAEFDELSKKYALEQEQRMQSTAQMEHYIYEYLETANDNCNIDDRGVQLINNLIQGTSVSAGR